MTTPTRTKPSPTTTKPQSEPSFTLTSHELHTLALSAITAKSRAYCPYSHFRVGAAFLDATGAYTAGANVEVASTPVGTCAERCALAPLVASYTRPEMPVIRACAVSSDVWPPASCCGMCRQMIREFCHSDMKIYMYGRQPQPQPQSQSPSNSSHIDTGTDNGYADITPEHELRICGEPTIRTIGELLPLSFGPEDMNR